MKRWQYLKKGDVVDIIAPASHCPPASLEAGVSWLNSVGLVPRYPENVIAGDVFFASSFSSQLEQLTQAIHSDSKAIWCLRGGYGSMRLIPELLKLKAPARAKVLLGFSDITALHLFVNQHWGWASVHGRNISSMHPGPQSKDRAALRKLLFGATPSVTFRKLRPLNDAAATDRTLRAPVMGGNLRLLQTSLGTSWELQTRNRIVFIEDVGERGYSVHRMLEQLYQTGHLRQGLKALVVGQFTESLEKDGRDLVPEALERFARMVRFPVLTGLPCGHGDVNYPVPFNAPAELSLGKKAALSIDSGGR